MASLYGLFFLTLAFSNIVCFARSVPLESHAGPSLLRRGGQFDPDLLRKLPRCENPPYQYFPAGLMLSELEDPFDFRHKRAAGVKDPKKPIILCTPGTETYIKLTRQPPIIDTVIDINLDRPNLTAQFEISSVVGLTFDEIEGEHLPPHTEDAIIDKGEGWILHRTSPDKTHQLLVANAHHAVPVPRWSANGRGTMKMVGNEITWGVLRAALDALRTFAVSHGWGVCTFEVWDGMNQVGTAKIVALT